MLEQLGKPVAKRAQVSIEALVERIGRAITAAERDGAHGAVASNHALLLKIVEMVRNDDRAGSLAEFSGLQDEAQVVGAIIDELGIDYAIRLSELVIEAARRRAADRAVLVGA